MTGTCYSLFLTTGSAFAKSFAWYALLSLSPSEDGFRSEYLSCMQHIT